MKWIVACCLLAIANTAGAVVVRADLEEARYRIPAAAFPALADLPGEGHGVLIAPQWVVTAAHATPMQMPGMDQEVSIGGVAYRIRRVVLHPGYRKPPDALVQEALASRDFAKFYAFLAASDDIALIELATPVTGVAPAALYRGGGEVGMTAELIGKGATGDGNAGQDPHGAHRGVLRHAFNTIVGADPRYLSYRFDAPPAALPLEGITGSGDSGGPLLIGTGDARQLIGLASWGNYPPDHPFWATWTADRPFVQGLYGQIVHAVRVSRYLPWIEQVMSASTGDASSPTPPPAPATTTRAHDAGR
ncbi:trypsin-like serine protease [Xanthomonas sp. LF07-6]|uniref:S1 family peptidase n=1 Tax=Xanthomonas sp. LF07-6 TaxID=3097550 RepID=UPI0025DDAAED|nr:trypsin-like serine protease [Xanthomonas sp. LF07-6]MDY4339017.1 trypsin-like serine protease [Xanthomonas sp. LF07-6]